MQLGKVIGQIVATIKDSSLEGLRLFVVQGLDENMKPAGKPFAAVDGIRCAGVGDVVYLATKRDAALALSDKQPVDMTIVGYVDQVAVEQTPGGIQKSWTPGSADDDTGAKKE